MPKKDTPLEAGDATLSPEQPPTQSAQAADQPQSSAPATEQGFGDVTHSVEASYSGPDEVIVPLSSYRNISPSLLTLDSGARFRPGQVRDLTQAEVERFTKAAKSAGRPYIYAVPGGKN